MPSTSSTTLFGDTKRSGRRRQTPSANAPSIRSKRTLHAFPSGTLRGNAGRALDGLASTATQPRRSLENLTPANGWLRIRSRTSRTGRTDISRSNGKRSEISRRIVAGAALPRTRNVPAAPTFTASRCASATASCAGRKTFFPPTFAARRNTTWATVLGCRQHVEHPGVDPAVGRDESPLVQFRGAPGEIRDSPAALDHDHHTGGHVPRAEAQLPKPIRAPHADLGDGERRGTRAAHGLRALDETRKRAEVVLLGVRLGGDVVSEPGREHGPLQGVDLRDAAPFPVQGGPAPAAGGVHLVQE